MCDKIREIYKRPHRPVSTRPHPISVRNKRKQQRLFWGDSIQNHVFAIEFTRAAIPQNPCKKKSDGHPSDFYNKINYIT